MEMQVRKEDVMLLDPRTARQSKRRRLLILRVAYLLETARGRF